MKASQLAGKCVSTNFPKVLPDVLLGLETEQVLGRFEEGFKHLLFAAWKILHFFSTLMG